MSQKPFTFEELQAIVAMLRSKNGCPWDKAQTYTSIRQHLLEEAYEANQAAIDLENTGNPDNMIEELGDLLFQILLQAQIGSEKGEFTMDQIIDHIARKMIHRHPHVFGSKTYEDSREQSADWEKLKAEEGGHTTDSLPEELKAVASAFPALLKAQKYAKKTTRAGLYSPESEEILHDTLEGLVGLFSAGNDKPDSQLADPDMQKSLGKVLFSLCRYADLHRLNAEMALLDELDAILKDAEKM